MSLPNDPSSVLLLHNARCSKSRKTHQLLSDRGIEFQERVYLQDPLDAGELAELARRLGRSPRDWVRTGQAEYAEAGLSADSSEEEILAAMVRFPILMERPIVVRGDRAVVGRPPEDVLGLFA